MTLVDRFDSVANVRRRGFLQPWETLACPGQTSQTIRTLCKQQQLPVFNALQPLQRLKLCFLQKKTFSWPHCSTAFSACGTCTCMCTSFPERGRRLELSVHYSARQNGFEEQVVRQQEQGGGGVDGHACGGGGGPRFRQRPTHQPSLPVSGVKIWSEPCVQEL